MDKTQMQPPYDEASARARAHILASRDCRALLEQIELISRIIQDPLLKKASFHIADAKDCLYGAANPKPDIVAD